MNEVLPSIVTVDQVAAAAGGKISAADPRLPGLIAGASDGIRLLCGWHITPVVDETLVLDGTGGTVLQVPTGRVINVTGVRVGGVPAAFDWSAAGMIELCEGRFPERFRSVEVDLLHGHPTAPAVASIVTQAVLGAAASPMGATSEQAGQIAIRWARTGLMLDANDLAMLAPYRIQNWA